MTSIEKEIVSRIKSGDEMAFELVFKSYYPALCAYAADLVKLNHQAEEIVQEVLIRLWEIRDQLEITTSLKSYLFRSVHNQCLNFIRHSKVIKSLSEKFAEDIIRSFELTLYAEPEFPLDYYFYDGLEQDIRETIHNLPEQCRRIFQMSRFDRLPHEQIASTLNISVNTVKTQISRALEKLRTEIGMKISAHQKKLDSKMGFFFWLSLNKRTIKKNPLWFISPFCLKPAALSLTPFL